MKKSLLVLSLTFSVLNLQAGEKEDEFEKSFFNAIATSDEAMFKLVEFGEGAPLLFDDLLKDSLKKERIKKITEVKFLPLEDDTITEFNYEGVDYVTTLPIEIRFNVTYKKTDDKAQVTSTSYSLGTKDGVYKIVAPKPKPE